MSALRFGCASSATGCEHIQSDAGAAAYLASSFVSNSEKLPVAEHLHNANPKLPQRMHNMTNLLTQASLVYGLLFSACAPVADLPQQAPMFIENVTSSTAHSQAAPWICTASGAGMAGTCVNR